MTLIVGYAVVRWAVPDLARWAIIAIVSLPATIATCELIRRVGLLRLLLGMRARRALVDPW